MKITVDQLIKAGIAPTQARQFAEPLTAACALYAIDTPARIGALIGQARVESRDFTQLEENLNYTTTKRLCQVWPSRFRTEAEAVPYLRQPKRLANFVYAGRNGNGDEASGDGWLYRGRGFQLTGRTNYAQATADTGRPYLTQPDLVAQPSDACLAFVAFWHRRGLNVQADAWNLDAITKAVNGPAMLEAAAREQYSEEARQAFA